MEQKKVESPDVPKEDGWLGKLAIEEAKKHNIGTSSSFTWRHAFCVGYSHQEKELADLRAERDKLKEMMEYYENRTIETAKENEHFRETFKTALDAATKHIQADNERLKEGYNKLIEMCIAHICSSPYMPEYGPISIPVKKVREELELALKSYLENK